MPTRDPAGTAAVDLEELEAAGWRLFDRLRPAIPDLEGGIETAEDGTTAFICTTPAQPARYRDCVFLALMPQGDAWTVVGQRPQDVYGSGPIPDEAVEAAVPVILDCLN